VLGLDPPPPFLDVERLLGFFSSTKDRRADLGARRGGARIEPL
jgi:hypothetical protein